MDKKIKAEQKEGDSVIDQLKSEVRTRFREKEEQRDHLRRQIEENPDDEETKERLVKELA